MNKKTEKNTKPQTSEQPRYNKTWEAVLKYKGTVKLNDPTLLYR